MFLEDILHGNNNRLDFMYLHYYIYYTSRDKPVFPNELLSKT